MEQKRIAKTAHDIAKAKGWWDEKRPLAEVLMLIISECGEAVEADRLSKRAHLASFDLAIEEGGEEAFDTAFRTNIKDTLEDELADIIIRIADLIEREEPGTDNPGDLGREVKKRVSEAIFEIVEDVCSSFDYSDEGRERVLVGCLLSAWRQVEALAKSMNIDIARHIELKMKYNETRPRKHGKLY